MTSLSPKAGFFFTLALGAVLRFWPLTWGAPPQISAPDESYHAGQAVSIYSDWRIVFREPYTPLYDRALSLLLLPQRVLSGPPAVTANLFHLGRALSALCDAAGVAVTYLLGMALFGSVGAGLAGGLFHALCFECLKHSKYMTPDALATLLALLSLLAGVWFTAKGERRYLVAAGFLAAAATAAKFNNVLLLAALFPMALVHKTRVKNAAALAAVFVVSLPLFFPSIIPFAKEVLMANRNLARPGEPFKLTCEGGIWAMFLHDFALPHEEMSTRSLWGAMGWLPGALGLSGLVWGFKRRTLLPVSLFAGATLLAAARLNIVRYALPAFPLMGILGAGLLSTFLRTRRAWTVALLLLCAQPLWKALRYDARLNREDTRIAAGRWIAENLPQGSVVALFKNHFWSNPELSPAGFRLVDIPFALYSSQGVREDRARPLDFYRAQSVRYVVVNSFMTGHHLNPASMEAFPETCRSFEAFYASLDHEAVLLFKTLKSDGKRPGPDIRIYRL